MLASAVCAPTQAPTHTHGSQRANLLDASLQELLWGLDRVPCKKVLRASRPQPLPQT